MHGLPQTIHVVEESVWHIPWCACTNMQAMGYLHHWMVIRCPKVDLFLAQTLQVSCIYIYPTQ